MSLLTFKNSENIVILNTNILLLVITLMSYIAIKILIWRDFLLTSGYMHKIDIFFNKYINIVFFFINKNVYTIKLLQLQLLLDKEFSFSLWNYYVKRLYRIYINKFNNIWLDDLLKKPATITLDMLLKLKNQFKLETSINSYNDKNEIDNEIDFLIKPHHVNNLNQIGEKQLIRNSKCFNKTKYSFIRQECKNIVYTTLLINIIVVFMAFNIYMHWRFINFYLYIFIIIYIILYIKYLFKFKSIYKKILRMYYQVKKKPLN